MDGSSKRQFERSEHLEPGENPGHRQPSQESGSRVFPATSQLPMQPPMYPFIPQQQQQQQQQHIQQQQHMRQHIQQQQQHAQHPQAPDYMQGQNPFVLASQVSNSPYSATPFPMGLNGSLGPSPIPTALPQQVKGSNLTVPPTGAQTPQQGYLPSAQFDNEEFPQELSAYYQQAQINRKSPDLDAFSKPYNPNYVAPYSDLQGVRHPAGITGHSGQYHMGSHGQNHAPGSHNSPNAPNLDAGDERLNNQRLTEEGNMHASGQNQAIASNFMAAALRFQNLRKYHSDRAVMRLHEFINTINQSGPRMSDSGYWRKTMNDMFTPRATLRYTKKIGTEYKFFEIAALMMPMMWVALGSLDVQRIEIVLMQLRADTLSNGNVFFHTPALTFSYHYSDGSQITYHAHMKGSFCPALKLEWLDILVHKFTPGMSWNSMERALTSKPEALLKLAQKLIQEKDYDQKVVEDGKDVEHRRNFAMQSTMKEMRSNFTVFRNISDQGVHEGMMRVLQVGDVMSALTDVYLYQRDNNIESPLDSLSLYVKDTRDGATPNGTVEQNGQGPNQENHDSHRSRMPPMANASPACSPRDMKGTRSGSTESLPAVKRRRSNKAVSKSAKTPSDSGPSSEDRNGSGIPGTKKIKF